jgi:hypothetical protein
VHQTNFYRSAYRVDRENKILCLCLVHNKHYLFIIFFFFFLCLIHHKLHFFPIHFYFIMTKNLGNLRKLYVNKYVIYAHGLQCIPVMQLIFFLPTYIDILQIIYAPLYVNFTSRHCYNIKIDELQITVYGGL